MGRAGWGAVPAPGGTELRERAVAMAVLKTQRDGGRRGGALGEGGRCATQKQREDDTAKRLWRVWAWDELHHPWSLAHILGFVLSCFDPPLSSAFPVPRQHSLLSESPSICRVGPPLLCLGHTPRVHTHRVRKGTCP